MPSIQQLAPFSSLILLGILLPLGALWAEKDWPMKGFVGLTIFVGTLFIILFATDLVFNI